MTHREKILQQIKQIVMEKDPSATIYLYGSRARGKAGKGSDWDLLILLDRDKITPEIEKSIAYSLYDLEFDTGEIISPMIYSLSEWFTKYRVTPFFFNVMKEGKKI
jgi:predicted nucleotidyltransferase